MKIEDKVLEVAKFLEIEVHKLFFLKDPNYVRVILGKEEDFDWDSINDFNPHTNWNWLHKAWERFRGISDVPLLHKRILWETKQNLTHTISNGTISEAFESLYNGINWYNNLNKEK